MSTQMRTFRDVPPPQPIVSTAINTNNDTVPSGVKYETPELKVEDESIVFKLELEEPVSSDLKEDDSTKKESPSLAEEAKDEEAKDEEAKDEENSEQTVLTSSNGMPLAVPMMANTMHTSVTRNDAKIITETRLKRLRALSQKPDEALSLGQRGEKKRIVRLEKNRRAAAMSRRKKKIYVKNLEENSKLMARHIAILELENSHLRAFMNATQHGQAMRPGIPPMPPHHQMFKTQQFSAGNMSQFGVQSAASNPSSTGNSSLEPPTKRRKLVHDTRGSSLSDNCSEMDGSMDIKGSLEPLPLPIPTSMPMTAPPPVPRMVPMMPNHMMMPRGPHPSRMMGYPMHHPMNPMMVNQGTLIPPAVPSSALPPPQAHLPEIGKLQGIVTEPAYKKEPMEDCKSVESDLHHGYLENMPPPVTNEGDSDYCHLSLLDDAEQIDETVDECGSVLGFQPDLKSNNMVFL